jgi:hypothetical protein
MKKASKLTPKLDEDDLRPEYRLDYSKARPNRFVENLIPGGAMVVLEPDVAEVFRSSESVNRILRSLITAVRDGQKGASTRKRKAG